MIGIVSVLLSTLLLAQASVTPSEFRMEDMDGPLYCLMESGETKAVLGYAFARNLPIMPSIHAASSFLGRGMENIVNIGKMTELNCTGCVINLPEDWEPEDFADKPLLQQPEKPFPVPF
ncbi:uncharacterized protein LOC119093895 [Pollicipes pollicipes]|uniref:uncharacterized protein LOC119093895 n=1 Tax=Pollicipes pollicipes TaxID=41117 RepID=UPI0018859A65|nr:uncharacterized protein LOC119093895 [Pollicipes pollicipes]